MLYSKGRFVVWSMCLLGLFAFTACGNAVDARSAHDAVTKTYGLPAGFDKRVEQALLDFDVPGAAIGVVVDGEVILAKGYGLRNKSDGLPVTEDTVFAIGSCTKAFTTFVLGTLVDEGLIEWDTPVVEYIPEFKLWDEHATEHITVRDLVTHRSGLPRHDFAWYNSSASRKELFSRLRYFEPASDLRERVYYNNLMYMAAGYLIERITGESWEDSVKSRVFTPLKMQRSTTAAHSAQKQTNFSFPHSPRDGKAQEIPFRDIIAAGPAGSIYSTVQDMAQWVRLHLSDGSLDRKSIVQSPTLREMHTSQAIFSDISAYPTEKEQFFTNYGLGWVISAYRGYYKVWHNGEIDGFYSLVSLLPQEKIGVVVLTNSLGGASGVLANSLTSEIFDALLGLKSEPKLAAALEKYQQSQKDAATHEEVLEGERVANTQPSHALKDYAGVYEHPGYGKMTIQMSDGQISSVYNDILTPLTHWHYDTYSGAKGQAEDPTFEGFKFSFQTDSAGHIAAVAVPLEPKVGDIVFKRKADEQLTSPEFLKKFGGTYKSDETTVDVFVQGNHLSVVVPRQPQYDLVPDYGLTFKFKDLAGFSVRFLVDDAGVVTELQFIQPNGVFSFAPVR